MLGVVQAFPPEHRFDAYCFGGCPEYPVEHFTRCRYRRLYPNEVMTGDRRRPSITALAFTLDIAVQAGRAKQAVDCWRHLDIHRRIAAAVVDASGRTTYAYH